MNVSLNTYIYYRPYPGQADMTFTHARAPIKIITMLVMRLLSIEQMSGLSEFIVDRFPHVSHLRSNEKGSVEYSTNINDLGVAGLHTMLGN